MEHKLNGIERTFPKKKAGATIAVKPKSKKKKLKAADSFEFADSVQKKRKKGSKTRRQKRAAAFEAKIAAKKAASAETMLKKPPGLPSQSLKESEEDSDEEEHFMDVEEDPKKSVGKEEASGTQGDESDEDSMEEEEAEEGGKGTKDTSDEEEEEDESAVFRKEIADMPMAKVRELKEKLGIKLFNKAFFGESSKSNTANKQTSENHSKNFGRENAKRPREMSSKRPVSKFKNVYANEKLEKERFDPRFEDRCGEFDEFIHRSNYAFLDDIKLKERKMLEKEIQKTKREDPEKAEKMKESLRRIKNREKAVAEKERNREVLRQLRRENNERLRRGEKPVYLKRSEVKMRMMEKKYEELKKTNSLDHYLERKAKKQNRKGDGAPI